MLDKELITETIGYCTTALGVGIITQVTLELCVIGIGKIFSWFKSAL